ncbi:hypothetical protein [Salinibacterium xinjiangense]|uniref:hypothetical protein n=1 Tax=Salinibacterium xinjiangense TaxID=386302 RepID=UPI00117BDC5E|nr:hypothetical protein [Salinibacterium xinjiangense]
MIATPLLLFGARAALPGIPWKRYARPSSWVDIGLIALGAAGLVLHCVAMFYPSLIETIPGTGGYIQAVDGMSTASIVLYIVPAVIVLAGLRRQRPLALTLVAVTLIAVGVTMYDGGPLNVHLVAITAAALSLAFTTALLVLRPQRTGDRAAPGHAATGR